MSAPQTNIETQEKRHIGPLLGMGVAVLFALGAGLWWAMSPEEPDTPIATSTTPAP
jgi:hypothetical protein